MASKENIHPSILILSSTLPNSMAWLHTYNNYWFGVSGLMNLFMLLLKLILAREGVLFSENEIWVL